MAKARRVLWTGSFPVRVLREVERALAGRWSAAWHAWCPAMIFRSGAAEDRRWKKGERTTSEPGSRGVEAS
jgi:hypothetical protein